MLKVLMVIHAMLNNKLGCFCLLISAALVSTALFHTLLTRHGTSSSVRRTFGSTVDYTTTTRPTVSSTFTHRVNIRTTTDRPSDVRWSLVQSFLEVCQGLGLETILVEPDILKEIDKGHDDPNMWPQNEPWATVTMATIDPSDQLLKPLTKIVNGTLKYHVIYDEDTRNVSASFFVKKKSFPIIPVHFLFWSHGLSSSSPLLHLMVLRSRGDYFWHSQLSPLLKKNAGSSELPLPLSKLPVGQHAGLIDRFETRKKQIEALSIRLPVNISAFLRSLQGRPFVECKVEAARTFCQNNPENRVVPGGRFLTDAMDLLRSGSKAMNKVGVPFVISSGTVLGWYRQCDVIPYTNDVDIEMKIKDYRPGIADAMLENGLPLIREIGNINDSLEMTFRKKLNLDLFSMYEEDDHLWTGQVNPSNYAKFRLIFPKYSTRWALLRGLRVPVPYPTLDYVEAMYGKEWNQPDSNFNWLTSPRNLKSAGFWPVEDRPNMWRTYR